MFFFQFVIQGVSGMVGPEGMAGEPGRPGLPGLPGFGKPGLPVGLFNHVGQTFSFCTALTSLSSLNK